MAGGGEFAPVDDPEQQRSPRLRCRHALERLTASESADGSERE